jgi:hypothetical protein
LRKTGPIGGPTWQQHEREKVSQVECAKRRRKRNLVSAPRVLGPNGPSVGQGGWPAMEERTGAGELGRLGQIPGKDFKWTLIFIFE